MRIIKTFLKNHLTFCFILFLYSFFFTSPTLANNRIYYSEGMNGAISCGHPLAAKAAIEVLKDGGNAVDAAIAAAFVLGVVDFTNSGIGGEGFALIYHPSNKVIAIDGSTKRPLNDIKNEYNSNISLPAIPEMLLKMRRLYGSKSAKTLLKPAINICNNGFIITPYLEDIISQRIKNIKDINALNLIAPNGKALKSGQILKQKKLGNTLTQLSLDQGLSFYYGADSDKTLSDMKSKGSSYNKYDFMHYKSRLCKPVKVNYKNYEIYGNPLPSSSIATIKLALKLLATNQPLLNQTYEDFFKQANICRDILDEKYYILSSYYNNPYDYLNSNESKKSKSLVQDIDDTNTTHLCVWDKNNMIVSMTLTLGNHFGTGQLAPGGFFYANSLRVFSRSVVNYPKDYPDNYGPLTTKSPIIVLKSKKPWLALGGAGANRIITNTALMLARMIQDFGIEACINEPRYYMEFNSKIIMEENKKEPFKNVNLKLAIPNIEIKNYLHDYFGLLSAIFKPDLTEPLQAVGDKHRDGSCLAY